MRVFQIFGSTFLRLQVTEPEHSRWRNVIDLLLKGVIIIFVAWRRPNYNFKAAARYVHANTRGRQMESELCERLRSRVKHHKPVPPARATVPNSIPPLSRPAGRSVGRFPGCHVMLVAASVRSACPSYVCSLDKRIT